jgi:hypothetical protein
MKQLTIIILFSFSVLFAFGQDKKDLAISLSGGLMNSPYYTNAHARSFYGVGFDYHLSKRQIISASYVAGKHDYFDNSLSNTPASEYIVMPNGINAEASYNAFSVMFKYKVVNHAKFSLVPGIGTGMMTHSREYPFTVGNAMRWNAASWSAIVFPVTVDMGYKFTEQWQLGLTGGFLIHPDYPILALHSGPRLTYILK